MGAAVLAGGRIVTGCNIENASFGLTICAERVAVFNAVSQGYRIIEAIAVACPDATIGGPDSLKMPCGACRQILIEFGDRRVPIIVDGIGEFTLEMLLPVAFQFRPCPPAFSTEMNIGRKADE